MNSPLIRKLQVLGVLLIWILLSIIFAQIRLIPGPFAVVQAFKHGMSIYGTNVGVTLSVSTVGFCIGNAEAIILGILFVQVTWAERLLFRIAVASFCVPLVAIAPILVVILPGDGPKQALAALSVFFPKLIAVVLALS